MVWFSLTFFFSLLLPVNCFHLSAPSTATVGVPITVTWTREKPTEPVDFSLVYAKFEGTPNIGDSVLVQSNGAQSGTASITINDDGQIFLGAYNTTNLSDTDIPSLAVLSITLVQVSPASQNQGSETQTSSSVSTSVSAGSTTVVSTSPAVTSPSTTSDGSRVVPSNLASQNSSFTSSFTTTSTNPLVVGQATETLSSESQTTTAIVSDPSESPSPNEPVHGLSASQKAGIAAGGGVFLLLLLLAGLLLCYRRRRRRSKMRLSSLADIDPYDSCASSSMRTQSLPLQSDTLLRDSMMTLSVDPETGVPRVFYKEPLLTSLRPVSNPGQEMISPVRSGTSHTRTRELSTLSYASHASLTVSRDYDRKSRTGREEDLESDAPPPLYTSRPPSGYLGSRTFRPIE